MGRSKYHAKPTIVHGFRFASQREAKRYVALLWRGVAGEIRNLELQPRFPIVSGGLRVADYIADFRYQEFIWMPNAPEFTYEPGYWADVVEDVKGVRTAVYRLKKKLVESQHGIVIREV